MNTGEFLSISSAICPDRLAVIFEGKRNTFDQLNQRVERLAVALRKMGVKKGDKVALLQVNCIQCIEVYFAVAKIGAVYLPLNYRAKAEELEYMINFAEVHTFFVGDRYLDLVDSIRSKLDSRLNYVSLEVPHNGMLLYEDLIKSAESGETETDIDEGSATILMYTAGTTGRPKGVILPHNSFSVYVLENVSPPDPEIEEKNILTVPLYHIAGIQAMMSAVYGARTLVIQRQFEAGDWMELVEKERVNRAMMVPTMLKQLMDHPDFNKHDLSSLKVITYGAAPMPLSVITRALEAFPQAGFINAFGQTETASTITMLGPEDHVISGSGAEREKKLQRLISIGRPLPDVEMKITDESGMDLPAGKIGEILARGPRVMTGYFKDEEKTSKTIDKDGWVHTGDMGYRDEDNYFYLAGRSTDLIKRAGEYISPEELENVMYSHPKVEDVAVIGVQDEEWGELPVAVCVLRKGTTCTPEEIMEYCRIRLASFKRPRSVIFADELPRNAMGKVVKRELRAKYANS
ncbi:MAG: long-chain-fatty-acid--CoA ligase [Dehalococcoidales bacterium]|nr:long-chain-fatty-acid--CoA ligase [Dehalococcoidales bacterium]